jgi:4-carboxymuconolactone decarboxylase
MITIPTDDELSPEALATLKTVPPLNVFRMMARAPSSLAPFIQLARSVLVGSELGARQREIAVLRVGHVSGSRYVFEQHVALAKMVGVKPEEIEAIQAAVVTGLDDDGRLLCRVADEITKAVRLSDAAFEQTVARFGTRQASELIFCCSYFNMVARFNESMRVPLDLFGKAAQ